MSCRGALLGVVVLDDCVLAAVVLGVVELVAAALDVVWSGDWQLANQRIAKKADPATSTRLFL
ncbi:MAG TPA: hypothetical protein VL354_15740 [Spirochaetia bacterium]|nr:hypothetical protein [Spirochaetia bacterium]